jgi:hypothetical protein
MNQRELHGVLGLELVELASENGRVRRFVEMRGVGRGPYADVPLVSQAA